MEKGELKMASEIKRNTVEKVAETDDYNTFATTEQQHSEVFTSIMTGLNQALADAKGDCSYQQKNTRLPYNLNVNNIYFLFSNPQWSTCPIQKS